jgi:hypothetical protein
MFEWSEFRNNQTLKIIESRPPRRIVRKELRAVTIGPDPKNRSAKPHSAAIDAILHSLVAPEKIRLLYVDGCSKITRLPNIARFKNLEYLHILGGRIRAYGGVGNLARLRELWLVGYCEKNIDRFPVRDLEMFRAQGGRLEEVAVDAKFVFLQVCTKLIRFRRSRIDSLCLEACNRLELDTLGQVRGLTTLELVARRDIPSFDFIGRCPNLKKLVVSANALKQTDMRALHKTRTLQRVFLGMLKERAITDLAMANPHLVVTNGRVCYREGVLQEDNTAFFEDE